MIWLALNFIMVALLSALATKISLGSVRALIGRSSALLAAPMAVLLVVLLILGMLRLIMQLGYMGATAASLHFGLACLAAFVAIPYWLARSNLSEPAHG